jgi:uncharacterized HAD superfamily protein
MARRTVYVDMDDVLCRTAQAILGIVEREFGKRLRYEDLTSFDLEASCSLSRAEIEELFRIVHRPEELLAVEPMQGAVEVMEAWARSGYEIAIVTGRLPSTYEASLEWLKRHRVPHDALLMVDKFGRFRPEDGAGITLGELAARRFAWAVEDSPTVARYLAEEMGVTVALIDHPWNRGAPEHPAIRRHRSWREIGRAFPGDGRAARPRRARR